MPNWSEGIIKVRGNLNNIKKFLYQGISGIPSFEEEMKVMRGEKEKADTPEVSIEEDEFEITMTSPYGFYVNETTRAFIEGGIRLFIQGEGLESEEEILTIPSFRQAWGVDAVELSKISEKYNVDIKIYAFERGMQFNQDIEIHKGKIIKDKEIQFKDYEWECLMPHLGG